MIDLKDPISKHLIKPWTAHGILIFRKQAHCAEIEVPFLALDAEELGRAIAANLQYIKRPGYPKEALDPDITVDRLYEISQAWMRELSVAKNELTLAAALLARRMPWSPMTVTKRGLASFAGRHLLRGGRALGNPDLVEFLFILDGPSPTIYVSSQELAAVTRYVGTEFLSIRVSAEELRLRIQDAVNRLEKGGPPTPRSMTNMEDWLTREGAEKKHTSLEEKDDIHEE